MHKGKINLNIQIKLFQFQVDKKKLKIKLKIVPFKTFSNFVGGNFYYLNICLYSSRLFSFYFSAS